MSLVKPHGSDVLVPLLLEGEAQVAELAQRPILKKSFN